MSGMIDPTITLGNIAELGTIIIGGIAFFLNTKTKVDDVAKKVEELREDVRDLTSAVTQLAVVNNRLNNVEEDIREMKRGRGFIQEEIKGEWPRRG